MSFAVILRLETVSFEPWGRSAQRGRLVESATPGCVITNWVVNLSIPLHCGLLCLWLMLYGGFLFSPVQVEPSSHSICLRRRTRNTVKKKKKMQTFLKGRRVGYWLSEKKMKKLNFQAFADLCRYVSGCFRATNRKQFGKQYIHIIKHWCRSELGGVPTLHRLLMTLTKGTD